MITQIEPWIDDEERKQLNRVIESTFVVEHALTKEFEDLTRELTGAKHAIATCNGTAALFCCLKALGIGPGDEVIVPDLTFVATANAVLLAQATPVLCDIDRQTFCLDIEKTEQLITPRTKAIIPVHLYGQCADMEALQNLRERHNHISIIEDAAQGVGVKFLNKHAGTFGDLGILSYYGNKTITCGEGGVILTDNDELAKACYRLKNHGRDQKGTFIHEHIGYNFSFTEMQAAIGIAQMHKLDRIIEKKALIRERYISDLADIEDFRPTFVDERVSPVFWFTTFLTDKRNQLQEFLKERGIQTRLFFYPLHEQPCYKGFSFSKKEFPVTSEVYTQALSLPSAYNLSETDQNTVIQAIRDFYAHCS